MVNHCRASRYTNGFQIQWHLGDATLRRFLMAKQIEKIDLAICTWNRADILEMTLESLKRLIVPYNCQLRAVIVDNNSTDRTAEVLKAFSKSKFTDRHSVLLLKESQQGHSHARNRAVESFDSDLVIWTNDDFVIDSFLIQEYVNSANANPTTSFFGKILPKFETALPKWITENWDILKGCFAQRDLGDESVAFAENCLPYGANFAVRTGVQIENRFDVALGGRGEEVHGEVELELMRRLIKGGLKGSWVPDAKVQHWIDAKRITEPYIRDYFVGQGKSLVANGKADSEDAKKLRSKASWQYWMYRIKRFFSGANVAKSKIWLSHLIDSGLAQGQAEAIESMPENSND